MSTSAPSSTAPSGVRRLFRSRDDRVVAGVCGGLGRYFDLDPVVVRIVVAALCLLGGAGVVAYLAAWLLVPEEGETVPILHTQSSVPLGRWRTIAGGGLLAVAAVVIVSSVVPGVDGGLAWPLVLGLIGALLVLSPGRESAPAEAVPAGPAPTGTGAAAVAEPAPGPREADDDEPETDASDATARLGRADAPTAVTEPDDPDARGAAAGLDDPDARTPSDEPDATTTWRDDDATTAVTAPITGFSTPAYGGAPDPRTQPTATLPPVPPTPRPPKRRRSPVGPIALGLGLVTVAVLVAVAAAAPDDLRWDTALAIVVIGWGAILAGAAFWGRATGLIVLGFVVAAFAALLTGAGLDLRGGVGDQKVTPTGAIPRTSTYRLAAGQLRIDLRHATLPAAGPTAVKASVGLGRLVVIVPASAHVLVTSTVQAGNLEAVDRFTDGADLSRRLTVGPTTGPTILLTASVGLGSLEIRRGDPPWPARDGGTTSTASAAAPSLLPAWSTHALS